MGGGQLMSFAGSVFIEQRQIIRSEENQSGSIAKCEMEFYS